MSTANIQLAQMDIIQQVLNVSDIKVLNRIKKFIINNREKETTECLNDSITAELKKDIDEARKEYQRGETLHFNGASDAQKWMASL